MSELSMGASGRGSGCPVFDPVSASEAMGLTPEEFALLLPKASKEIKSRLGGIRQGLERGDLKALALNSHTLKSVAASLGAEETRNLARLLELCARGGDLKGCAGQLELLEREAAELLAELDRA